MLEGDCTVEEAEPLLQLFQEVSDPTLNWTECTRLHTAVLQVVLAAQPGLSGPCGDPWVALWASFLHNDGCPEPGMPHRTMPLR
jgi:hypothetical protein